VNEKVSPHVAMITTNNTSGTPPISTYYSGCLLPDGRYLAVPYIGADVIRVWNTANGTWEVGPQINGGVSMNGEYTSGILAPNGSLILFPLYGTNFGIIDNVTDPIPISELMNPNFNRVR